MGAQTAMKPKKAPERIRRISHKGPKALCADCGVMIQSKGVDDTQFCKCKKIGIVGGSAYTRCYGNPSDFKWIPDEE